MRLIFFGGRRELRRIVCTKLRLLRSLAGRAPQSADRVPTDALESKAVARRRNH